MNKYIGQGGWSSKTRALWVLLGVAQCGCGGDAGGSISGRLTPVAGESARSTMRTASADVRGVPRLASMHNDEVLVVFEDHVDDAARRAFETTHGLTLKSQSPSGITRYQVTGRPMPAAPQARVQAMQHHARQMQDMPGVRFAEPNRLRYAYAEPDDAFYERQRWHFEALNLPESWDITTGSESVVVAVVDTGVLVDHPDLKDRLVDGYDMVSDAETSADGDGIDDDPDDPGGVGVFFHGTHVAGTIGAATDNGSGVAAVTWGCRIMPIRAMDSGGSGTVEDVVEAMRYAGGLSNASGTVPEVPAHIINLSLGGLAGEEESSIERATIQELVDAGITVVAAAGNDGSSLPAPPAFYPETISVGAIDGSFDRASYSNFGSTIDFMGPGGNLNGADANDDGFPDRVYSTTGTDNGSVVSFTYGYATGTSMAAPHISGVIALMLSVDPTLQPDNIRQVLTSTAVDLGASGRDSEFGDGLVDADAALQAVLAMRSDRPLIALSTTQLEFGSEMTTQDIAVRNVGGGELAVGQVVDLEDHGGDWMQVTTSGSDASTNVATLEVSVARAGLPEGTYTGTITVQADEQVPQIVNVSMSVSLTGLDNTFVIEVIESDSQEVVARAETTTAEDFAYTLQDVPPGTYRITAGTDIDGDGMICEDDDYCGTFEDDVVVEGGQSTSEIDITVSRM